MGIELPRRGEFLTQAAPILIAALAVAFAVFSHLLRRKSEEKVAHLREQVEKDLHELKTPLTVAKGYVDHTLDGETLSEEVREALTTARSSLKQLQDELNRFANQLRSFEFSDAKPAESVSLDLILRECVSMAQILSERKGLQFRYERQSILPSIRGTKSEFFTLVSQPLLNAIKYTPSGEIFLQAGASGRTAFIQIDDTGIGIPENEAERVFEAHYRATNADSTGEKENSQGLGLFVVKELCDQLGATIRVAPRTPQGTSFRLEIPLS